MYNADGSQGSMCGNGIRCVGKYVYDNGLTDKAEITVEEVEALRITRLKIKLLSALSSVNQGMLDEHLNKD